MLNIISRSFVEGEVNGPNKVVNNLIKGLEILGYPYCINKDLQATSQLWIHDDPLALKEASRLKLHAIAGPNIYILPKNISAKIDMSHLVYIQPSKWIRDFWIDLGFKRCPLDVWPSAIDTEEFPERPKPQDGHVLIYFKQRYAEELDFIKDLLEKKNIKYEVITYGFYDQKEYVEKLKNARYVIWLGRHETQGIALEEALAMNVPMIVWDVNSIGHWLPRTKDSKIYTQEESSYKNTTSAEYFDGRCGIKAKDKNNMEISIEKMEANWEKFSPRQYILENLGLEKQARELLYLYTKYFNIEYSDGQKETLRNNKKWRNNGLGFKLFSLAKSTTKKILGKKG
jgi:hypothetical protein